MVPVTQFVPGWSPDVFRKHREQYRASGRYCVVSERRDPLPQALSLAQYMLGFYNQGQQGTCWEHAAKEVSEITSAALNYQAFPICRNLIGIEGEKILGGGSPGDGGTVTAGLQTMLPDSVGMAHENLDPYSDTDASVNATPPQAVYADAKAYHYISTVEVNADASAADPFEQWKQLLVTNHAVGIGIWWPDNWCGPTNIVGAGGGGSYGHAQCVIGFAQAGVIDKEECYHVLNSWGGVYSPFASSLAAKIPGYKPWLDTNGKEVTYWVRKSGMLWVLGKGDMEMAAITTPTGIANNIVVPPGPTPGPSPISPDPNNLPPYF